MNITVSQWLQIAAIAISAVISISRWVWDAKKASRDMQTIQKASDPKLNVARNATSFGSRVAFFSPLAVILWQALSPGAATRFDLGIMILSGLVFTGFLMLQIVAMVRMILECVAAQSTLFRDMVVVYKDDVANTTKIIATMDAFTVKLPAKKQEIEQGGTSDAEEGV